MLINIAFADIVIYKAVIFE